ncbi:glycoside hydrolase family 35 protein [Auricularia subglabra TFB-10046 SS5]|nr:glycoside hydrolase family 35 protein [Auricularia subglabra TFB-10046 SS5]
MSSGPAQRSTTRGSPTWVLVFVLCFILFVPWDKLLRTVPDALPSLYASLLSLQAGQSKSWSSNGLTDLVQWDGYSLFVRGQRIFLWSGEFHTFRLPVPSLWLDILEKMKAAGLNAVSIYIDWALVHPSPGTLDFEGFRALQPFFEACMATGLWVVIRPGPYINAEVSGGGIPGWVTSEVQGHLRSNDSDFEAAWIPYMRKVIELSKSYQITEGGPIIAWQIENEYTGDPKYGVPNKVEYMEQLEAFVLKEGIVVPLTFNDASWDKQFATGPAAVDIYGVDSYPQSFDCSNPTVWFPVRIDYYDYHKNTNPGQPSYIPEFQGGAFDPWGPNAPGYDACRTLTGPEFESVFYKQLWASNVKLVNIYMLYGGTSWGSMPFPGVYTSYDYGSAIRESRELSAKYTELKRQSIFLRSAVEFVKTDVKGNSTDGSGAVMITNDSAFVTALRNPDTGAGFYVARQLNSSSLANVSFRMSVESSAGVLSIPAVSPSVQLFGRQSKVIVTDFKFGSSRLLYSTAEVFFAGVIDGRDVLFLHGDSRQWHETSIPFTGRSSGISGSENAPLIRYDLQSGGNTIVAFMPGIEGLITLWDSETQLVLYADSATAGTFWAPVLSSDHPYGAFWSIGTNETVLVGGPYLVRSANLVQRGSHLALRGDIGEDAYLTVIGPRFVSSISWNGQPIGLDVSAAAQISAGGAFVARLEMPRTVQSFAPPSLETWKFAHGLPEILPDYDDGKWTTADHETTNIPYKPLFGAPSVLYGCDYGFCEGQVLWRGHFNGAAQTTAVNLTINGGEAFAASVWLNGQFIKTTYGNSTNNLNIIRETNELYTFPEDVIRIGEDNVLTVLQDNQGLEEDINWDADASKSPRGIRGALLEGGSFSYWKVQGKLGGYTSFADRDRGVSNEGGTFGERAGWHLPGFNVTDWESRPFTQGLQGQAGVGVFVTHFELDVPRGFDVTMSLVFDEGVGETGAAYRAHLYVNGWMMGKRVANLGPQAKFPVHEGILDYHGKNTVAVVLWAMEASEDIRPSLKLVVDGRYETGMAPVSVNNPRWEPRLDAL